MSDNAVQIVNEGLKYIYGMRLTHVGDEQIKIASGQCRAQANKNDLELNSDVTVDITVNGKNGLDTGSVASDTWYAVYVIGDSYQGSDNGEAGLLSADLDSPDVMPSGYDIWRRVGYIKTDGSSDILAFQQTGAGSDRTMWWEAAIATDITNGNSASYADVDASDGAPASAIELIIYTKFAPTAGNDELHLRPNGAGGADGMAVMSGSAAGVDKLGILRCPCNSSAELEYKVTGSGVALSVQGYVDEL